jgi:hypothetical protein
LTKGIQTHHAIKKRLTSEQCKLTKYIKPPEARENKPGLIQITGYMPTGAFGQLFKVVDIAAFKNSCN